MWFGFVKDVVLVMSRKWFGSIRSERKKKRETRNAAITR